MWTRVPELSRELSMDERQALRLLDQGPKRPRIPLRYAERLIALGLAEVSVGRLTLTIPGRQILSLLAASPRLALAAGRPG